MKLIKTAIPEVVLIEPTLFADERGWFMESFNEEHFRCELKNLGLTTPSSFVQDNHSVSKKGVLRGLHYQLPPYEQGKIVRVVQGSAYDVAVDIREGSPTFGCSVSFELSAENRLMAWIPPGFAHGFLSLEDETHFVYKTTNFYNKESEAVLRWNDPDVAIDWPLAKGAAPIIIEKDNLAPLLTEIKKLPYGSGVKTNKQLINLRVIGDLRGSLISIEQGTNIPFNLKRAYYIFDTKSGVSRGFHAHKNLQQLAVCVKGTCRIVLDDGRIRENFWLDSPTKGLLINDMVWREMHDFSEDCVLAIFADELYNERDYIRDYNQFIKEATCE